MLEWIGSKWSLVVLMKICEDAPIRFNELFRDIPLVSEKVLSQVLKQLTVDGIISRKLFADVPPKVEYTLTELGISLIPHIKALAEWGKENFDQIMMNRKRYQ